jgi:hypothetical protein
VDYLPLDFRLERVERDRLVERVPPEREVDRPEPDRLELARLEVDRPEPDRERDEEDRLVVLDWVTAERSLSKSLSMLLLVFCASRRSALSAWVRSL